MNEAKLKYVGRVVNGELKIQARKSFNDEICCFEGKEVFITIERRKKQRSHPQNNFYWGVIIPIIQHALYDLGNIYTKEQVHDILKHMFLKEDVPVGKDGEFLTKIKSTTDLTTSGFMDYVQEITIWAATFLKVEIPEPGQQMEIAA